MFLFDGKHSFSKDYIAELFKQWSRIRSIKLDDCELYYITTNYSSKNSILKVSILN